LVVYKQRRFISTSCRAFNRRRRAPGKTAQNREEGRIEIRYQGGARPNREIEAPQPKPPGPIRLVEKPARRSRWKPPASHPWKAAAGAAALLRATASGSL